MKLTSLLPISAFALICLFSLQAFWLYYAYRLHLESIKESVNAIFSQTVEKEMDQRFLEFNNNLNLFGSNIQKDTFKIDLSGLENNSVVSQQVDMIQQLMAIYNFHFNINNCDSIFNSILQSNQFPFKFCINYTDSTGNIINTSGCDIDNGFKTIVLPVINGEKIYAIVNIPSPVVFRNMLYMLTVSILIFFFIITCIIYEMKVFLNHHKLNQLRENFTQALTHDMRTPLSTIHSVLVQFEKEVIYTNPEMKDKFNSVAIEQVIILQNTVDQILTFAYIDKKQISLSKEHINLPVLIQSLIDEFTIKANKVVMFQTLYEPENNVAFADIFYLKNAISNLIDNAIKYSDESVEISIDCVTGEKQVYIHVKDNGFGISEKDQLIIFNRYERGAEIKRNKISGFGIGLNYVQQVMAAHGGTVTLISQEKVGSEFILTIPIRNNIKEEKIKYGKD